MLEGSHSPTSQTKSTGDYPTLEQKGLLQVVKETSDDSGRRGKSQARDTILPNLDQKDINGNIGQRNGEDERESSIQEDVVVVVPETTEMKMRNKGDTSAIGLGSGDVSAYFNRLYPSSEPDVMVGSTLPKIHQRRVKNTQPLRPATRYATKSYPRETRLLSSIVKYDWMHAEIQDLVKHVSQTAVHASMIFNLFLIHLCDTLGHENSFDPYWSHALLNDDIYETCVKIIIDRHYYQRVEMNYMNCHYINYIYGTFEKFFGSCLPNSLSDVKKGKLYNYYYYRILRPNIVPSYKRRFLRLLRNTYTKRQEECVKCFVKFWYPQEDQGALVNYILTRINGLSTFTDKFDKERIIAEFVLDHQRYMRGMNFRNIKYQPFRVVRYFYFLSKYMEGLNSKSEYSMAPINKVSFKFIDVWKNDFRRYFAIEMPRDCRKIITDGDVYYFDYEKEGTKLRHRPRKYPDQLERLYTLSLKTTNVDKWKIFISSYLSIFSYAWNNK